jgi:alkylation response protein AidB-like acyl-CoA dehydrogenase
MEFDLTSEQLSLQKAAIDFARAELSKDMIQRDAERIFSHDGWKKCAAFGVQGLPIPEEFGGSGSDPVTTIALWKDSATARRIKVCVFD